MHLIVQAAILGLLTGGVYALMASGLTLAFGVMRVINVSQGAMIVAGAYVSYTLFTQLQIDPFVSIVIMAPAAVVVGVAVQLVFLRPLRSDEREELSLLVTWAIALGIEGILGIFYQTTLRATRPSYVNDSLTLFGFESNRVAAYAFGISVATATAAGAVFGMITPFNAGSHYDLISRLLTIIVLGGMGSLGGAVIAALCMGMSEAILAVEMSPTWASLWFFVILVLVLLIRPQGLLGTAERGKL